MQIAHYIDHTYLKPDARVEDIERLCEEAIEYDFYSVCIPPYFVNIASQILLGQPPKVCTVAGFPIGYDNLQGKLASIQRSIQSGAEEVDVVLDLGAVKSDHWNYVRQEIERFGEIGRSSSVTIKLIIETGLLTEEEIVHICGLCNETPVDFVKTSTGFFGEGATQEVLKLIRRNLRQEIKIKASGGIRTYSQVLHMIRAGANRIGCSGSVAIVREALGE